MIEALVGQELLTDVPTKVLDGARDVRVGAKALIADRGQILLVRERRDDGSTFWTLPGGGVHADESIVEGLHRELLEELQCRATVGDPVGTCVYEHSSHPDLVTFYVVHRCELDGIPSPNPFENVVDHRWIAPSDLPATTLDPFQRFLEDAAR